MVKTLRGEDIGYPGTTVYYDARSFESHAPMKYIGVIVDKNRHIVGLLSGEQHKRDPYPSVEVEGNTFYLLDINNLAAELRTQLPNASLSIPVAAVADAIDERRRRHGDTPSQEQKMLDILSPIERTGELDFSGALIQALADALSPHLYPSLRKLSLLRRSDRGKPPEETQRGTP